MPLLVRVPCPLGWRDHWGGHPCLAPLCPDLCPDSSLGDDLGVALGLPFLVVGRPKRDHPLASQLLRRCIASLCQIGSCSVWCCIAHHIIMDILCHMRTNFIMYVTSACMSDTACACLLLLMHQPHTRQVCKLVKVS